MAIKQAALDKVFTPQEMAKMDPMMLDRIKTGIEVAIVNAGGQIANPVYTQAYFKAMKQELFTLKPGPIDARRFLKAGGKKASSGAKKRSYKKR